MIRINLLPTKAAQKKQSIIQQLVVGVAAIAVVLVVWWVILGNKQKEIDDENAKIQDLNAKINQLKGIIKQVDDFKEKKRDLNRKISTIKKLNEQRSGPVKLLDEFTYVVPRKAWITVFRETNKQLTLEGIAFDGPTVADFIDSLRGSKFFQAVQLIQVTQVVDGGKKSMKFNVNCRVNYTPDGSA